MNKDNLIVIDGEFIRQIKLSLTYIKNSVIFFLIVMPSQDKKIMVIDDDDTNSLIKFFFEKRDIV